MNTRSTGTEYENKAAGYLESKGYRIIEKNYRCRYGEIDLVARDGDYFVFVEVKYRKDAAAGDPLEAVDYRKQKKICMTAANFIMRRHLTLETPIRFDVVAILGDRYTLIKNAFDYIQ